MPIYEYRCQCGAVLEALERVGAVRQVCGELCAGDGRPDLGVPLGMGQVERMLSAPGIRGDGREAKEPTFDPARRANRPGCDCEGG